MMDHYTTQADLYAMNITHSYAGVVWPFGDRIAIGLDWSNIGFDDQELNYSENKLNFSIGYQPFKMFSIGGTFKYMSRDMGLDGTSYGKSSGIGYDVGILFSPFKWSSDSAACIYDLIVGGEGFSRGLQGFILSKISTALTL